MKTNTARMRMKPTFKDKLISEAIDFYKIDSMLDDDEFLDDLMVDEPTEDDPFDFGDMNFDDDVDNDMNFDDEGMNFDDDVDNDMNFDDEGMSFDDMDVAGLDAGEESGDGGPNDRGNEGLIRTVRGAYMVYKRMTESNNYEELWIYNMKDVKTQTKIRNSILAGTDVDPVTLRSPEGDQSASIYSKGNIQYLHIDGLPN